jgi:magnesium chelatase family protein
MAVIFPPFFCNLLFYLSSKKRSENGKGEGSVDFRLRMTAARELQTKLFADLENVHYNTQMNTKQIRQFCKLNTAFKELLKNEMERLNLSARAYDLILKDARTIANLENTGEVKANHIGAAI